MIQSNRIFWGLPCTRKTGQLDDDGWPIEVPAEGYHANMDTRIFTDAATAAQADAIRAEIAPYIVTPATPQWSFGPDTEMVCLRWPDEATATGLSSAVAGGPRSAETA